jgi:hypothetical protein
MPEISLYSLRVAFVAQIAPIHTRSTKPLYGCFWGILGGVEQKGGSEYRQNRSQLPNVEKR